MARGDAGGDIQISELRQRLKQLENKYGELAKSERELASQHEELKAGWRDAEQQTAAAERNIMAIDDILAAPFRLVRRPSMSSGTAGSCQPSVPRTRQRPCPSPGGKSTRPGPRAP